MTFLAFAVTPVVFSLLAAESDLSPEDETFFTENLKKLIAKVEPSYDDSTGEITLEYLLGEKLKPDLIFPFGVDNRYTEYRGLTFAGNTKGFFLLRMPFKGKVVMEYQVSVEWMKNEGALSAIFMASEDGKSYLAANFGTVEVWKDGRRVTQKPPTDPQLKRPPNTWFRKAEPLTMKIIYEAKDEKTAQVSIWYDTDDPERDKPINVAPVPVRNGLVGLSWSMTRFNMSQLKITGTLDRRAAVAFLKKETKQSGGKQDRQPGGEPGAPAPPPAAGDKRPRRPRAGRGRRGRIAQADPGRGPLEARLF